MSLSSRLRQSPVPSEAYLDEINQIINPSVLKDFIPVRSPSRSSPMDASINKAMYVHIRSDAEEKSAQTSAVWIAKPSPNTLVALCEVIGQESIRLFSPTHTHRTCFTFAGGRLGVLSEQVPDWQPMTAESAKRALTPVAEEKKLNYIPGLGTQALLNLFFNETDFKLNHLDSNTAENIDGDYKFSFLTNDYFSKNNTYDENDIKSLPYLNPNNANPIANNWLDQVENMRFLKSSNLALASLVNDPNLELEVYEVSLRILILPTDIYKEFLSKIVLDEEVQKLFLDAFEQRRVMHLDVMFNHPGFLNYLEDFKEEKRRDFVQKQSQWLQSFMVSEDQPELLQIAKVGPAKEEMNMKLGKLATIARAKLNPPSLTQFTAIQSKAMTTGKGRASIIARAGAGAPSTQDLTRSNASSSSSTNSAFTSTKATKGKKFK